MPSPAPTTVPPQYHAEATAQSRPHGGRPASLPFRFSTRSTDQTTRSRAPWRTRLDESAAPNADAYTRKLVYGGTCQQAGNR